MAQEKLLHRERIIQASGVLLMLSPFFNFFISVYTVPPLDRWSVRTFWNVAFGSSIVVTSLWVSSFIIGFMMAKGRRASWLPILMMLGIYIVVNVVHFKTDSQSGWVQPVLSLLINVGLFALIYSQEFYQIRQIEMAAARPLGPLVKFDGHGAWARLLEVTPTHIKLRRISSPPENLSTRPLEIILQKGLVLPARLIEENNGNYLFQFAQMTPLHEDQLKKWIQSPQKFAA